MKRRPIKSCLFLIGLLAPFSLLPAQTAGNATNIRFEKVSRPVPEQVAMGGNEKGSNPAGDFYHANYTNVAWGDYDNDGFLDLFYSDRNDHIDSWKTQSNFYKNNANGTFTRLVSPFEATAFSRPVWLDVNNDGLLDLLLPGLGNWHYGWKDEETNLADIKIHLYLNRGKGEDGKIVFEEILESETGLSPVYNGKAGGKGHNWVSVGDYDKDGFVDVVMAGFDDNRRPASGQPEEAVRVVYLYRNINGERFELQKTPLDGAKEFWGVTDGSICFSDLDGDGWLDIMSTGYGYTRNSEMYIYWNNGNGTFSEGEQSFLGTNDSSSGICDLNNDGLPDVVMTGYYHDANNEKRFYVYKNIGNREFQKIDLPELQGADGAQLSFGDVNQDGFIDILMGGHGAKNEHSTWLYANLGEFKFEACGAHYNDPFNKKWRFSRVSHGSQHLIDYNNDGYLDAWLSGWSAGECSNGCEAKLWKNVSSTKGVASNMPSSAPENLSVVTNSETGVVKFVWSSPSDDTTPSSALQYNIYLKKKGSEKCFMTIPADIQTGFIKVGEISGQIGKAEYEMLVCDSGEYEWGVQAIDNGKKGSSFSHGSFTMQYSSVESTTTSHIKIYATDGTLYYLVEKDATLKVHDAGSTLILDKKISGSGCYPELPRGAYIVTVQMGDLIEKIKVII